MSVELYALLLAALLQIVQIMLAGAAARKDLGSAYLMGPRDQDRTRDLRPVTGRLRRAAANHTEGLTLFAIAVLGLTFAGRSTPLTQVCAGLYLGARILYVPAYAAGLAPWRSLLWGIGFAATGIILLVVLAGGL